MEQNASYLRSLKKDSVVRNIIDCLTDAIRDRKLKPGDKILPEPELAISLGVSRSSVREAIKILTCLGVLESKRSDGTFVCDGFRESMIDPMVYGIILNQDSFENLMELRQMTEVGIMRLAMQKYSGADCQALEVLLEQMRTIVESGDNMVDRFFHVDNDFHNQISQMGKNPLADKISRVVRTLTYSMRYETVSTMLNSGRGEELVAAHRQLYMTLKNRDLSHLNDMVKESYFSEALQGKPN